MSPETWKMDLYHKAEISKELYKWDSNKHSPYLQQKCVTGLRQSMENFNTKGVSLSKIWAQVMEDRQEQQLELYVRSSSSCQPLINTSPLYDHARPRRDRHRPLCCSAACRRYLLCLHEQRYTPSSLSPGTSPLGMWFLKGNIPLFWASMHGSLWLLVAWESCKHQRCGWVPHEHLQHRLRSFCVSSLSTGALHHCHDLQVTSKKGACPLPPFCLPGLVLANLDICCRRWCSCGEEEFHGDFPLHTWPLLVLLESLALLRPEHNQRQLQPVPAWGPHTASPQMSLPSLTAGQPSPEGSSWDNFQTIQHKWNLKTYFFKVSSCPEARYIFVHTAGAQQNGGWFSFPLENRKKNKNNQCCQLLKF